MHSGPRLMSTNSLSFELRKNKVFTTYARNGFVDLRALPNEICEICADSVLKLFEGERLRQRLSQSKRPVSRSSSGPRLTRIPENYDLVIIGESSGAAAVYKNERRNDRRQRRLRRSRENVFKSINRLQTSRDQHIRKRGRLHACCYYINVTLVLSDSVDYTTAVYRTFVFVWYYSYERYRSVRASRVPTHKPNFGARAAILWCFRRDTRVTLYTRATCYYIVTFARGRRSRVQSVTEWRPSLNRINGFTATVFFATFDRMYTDFRTRFYWTFLFWCTFYFILFYQTTFVYRNEVFANYGSILFWLA